MATFDSTGGNPAGPMPQILLYSLPPVMNMHKGRFCGPYLKYIKTLVLTKNKKEVVLMWKKRVTAVLLVFVLLIAAIPAYADNEPDYATRGEICEMLLTAADDYTPGLTREDIIKGYEDGSTKDDQFITRAESFVMVSRAFGTLPEPVGNDLRTSPDKVSFTDVPAWAENDVNNLINARVVIGTDDGTLHEKDNVTTEQMRTMIQRIWALKGSNLKDDYYNTVNKAWLDASSIRPGEMSAGGFTEVQYTNNQRLTGIIEDIVSGTSYQKGSKEDKITSFYHNVLDMDSRNEQGIQPIKQYLDKIDAVTTFDGLYDLQKDLMNEIGTGGLFNAALSADLKDSTKYAMYFNSVGTTLTKDIYAGGDETKVNAYKNYLTTILKLAGDPNPEEKVDAFYELEKDLSQYQLNPEDGNNVDKIYNVFTIDQLQELFPAADIRQVITDLGYQVPDQVIVMDTELLKAFAKYYNEEHLDLLKTLTKISVVSGYGGALNQEFLDASNEFSKIFYGIEGSKSMEEIASSSTQNVMSDYLGEIFVDKYFPQEAKEDVTAMVHEFIDIYKARIENLDWMSDTTKTMAKKKLDTMNIKIGYPDSWETPMDKVEIRSAADGGSYFENMKNIAKQSRLENIALQGKPVDKTTWMMSAYTVNAYYNASANEIVFPAGILQAPFYDYNASRESNLGGIGTVIAHEITHAFDNNGSKFDENGNAANWWTESDYAKFQELCGDVIKHYNNYEVAPGIYNRGEQTLSENIADLGGMACALEAMKKIENADYDAFFRNNAKIWEMTSSRQYLEYLNQLDVHSLNKARANRTITNFQDFYDTYQITETDGMYTKPEDRVKIW